MHSKKNTKIIEVSVLVINFNNKKYIKKCISSIINQTYKKKIEIIFHDDFSQDQSLLEIGKYKNIKIIKNHLKTQYGSFNQIEAVKRSLLKSKGKFIFLLDSDDYFKKDKIEKVINFFKKNEKIDIIFDLPIFKVKKQFKKKNLNIKKFQRYWSYIHPQSCISMRRKTLHQIISKVNFKKYPDLWLDFRVNIYAKYILKRFYIYNHQMTVYRILKNSASSGFKKFTKKWWTRRLQAHNYVKFFFKKNGIKHKKNLDYIFTLLVNKILK